MPYQKDITLHQKPERALFMRLPGSVFTIPFLYRVFSSRLVGLNSNQNSVLFSCFAPMILTIQLMGSKLSCRAIQGIVASGFQVYLETQNVKPMQRYYIC